MPFLPFVPFLNCVEIAFRGIIQAQQFILTAGAEYTTAISEAAMDNLALELDTWYHDELQPLICATAEFEEIRIADLTTVSSLVKVYAISGSHDGTQTGEAVPNNVAMSITLKTNLRGRSYRGRNYLGGLPAAALTNPTFWNATVQAAVLAAWLNLAEHLATAGFTHVVLSRYNDNVRRTVGVATPIIQYLPRLPIATMRRRVAGRGA